MTDLKVRLPNQKKLLTCCWTKISAFYSHSDRGNNVSYDREQVWKKIRGTECGMDQTVAYQPEHDNYQVVKLTVIHGTITV